eukprot:6122704-Pyramimonas_sp.AAC.2
MKVVRSPSESLWAPVACLDGACFVQARSLAMCRETDIIDLLSAHLQVHLGGEGEHYVIPAEIVDILPPRVQQQPRSSNTPVCRLARTLRGLQRS